MCSESAAASLCGSDSITHATNVHYEVSSQLAPQSVDMHLHSVAFDFLAPAVQSFLDLRARQDVARPLQQELQECELLGREGDFAAALGDTVGGGIKGDAQVLD